MSMEFVKRLIKLGAPDDLVNEAMELVIEVLSARKRRAADTERKRLAREQQDKKEKATKLPPQPLASADSQDSADVQDVPNEETTLSFLSSREEKKERKKEIARQPRGTKISADWKPTERHYTQAQQLGFSEAEVVSMAEDMRLWAEANSNRPVARKASWDLTFLSWMRRIKEDRDKRVVSGKLNGKPQVVRHNNQKHENWIALDSPEWIAWAKHRGKPFPLDTDGGWTPPTRWPTELM